LKATTVQGIKLQIGTINTRFNFVVAGVSDSVILGLYLLDLRDAIINFSYYSVTLDGREFQTDCCIGNPHSLVHIYRLVMDKKVIVPPHSVKLSTIKILGNQIPENDFVVQSHEI